MSFVKLDCGILDSSLWSEAATVRVVFVTILAMCDAEGLCRSTAPGIARRANLPLDDVRAALDVLTSPDPDSRSLAEDGRRLLRVDGGFVVVNYVSYREKDHGAAARMRRYRQRVTGTVTTVTRNDRNVTSTVTEAEAEADAKAEKKQGELSLPVSLDEPAFREAWADWIAYRRERKLATWKGRTVKAKLAELESAGAVEAVKAIRASIANGWSGIFPKAAGAPVAARRPRASSIACPPAHPDDLAALEAIGERFEVSP